MFSTKQYLRLKKTQLFLILTLFAFSCKEENKNFYKEVALQKGLPEILKPMEEYLPFDNFRYANLKTGSDSLQVMFGTLQRGLKNGHWVSIVSGGFPSFSAVRLEKNDSLGYLTKDIDIDFNDDRNRISLRIIRSDSTGSIIKYSWLHELRLSHEMVVQEIEKVLQKGTIFPDVKLKTLTDNEILSSEFNGKFVVINWWATWCSPCIEEIPGLNAIVEKYADNDNVRFIAITNESKIRILNFLKRKKFTYEMTFSDSVAQKMFGKTYPVNIIINPSGTITYFKEGAGLNTPSEIESSLKQQLEAAIR